MSSENTEKMISSENSAEGKNSKKVMADSAGKIKSSSKGAVIIGLNGSSDKDNNEAISPVSSGANAETSIVISEAPTKKATQAKKVAVNVKKAVVVTPAKKKAVAASKPIVTNIKKIKLAASCYHYYRNWLKEFMRSHGVSSARFQKSPDSYDGHITVLESEKVKGLKAFEIWNKENPNTKEMFWDVKK
jgi:hypothetical protein